MNNLTQVIEDLADARLRQHACDLYLVEIEELRNAIRGLERNITDEIEECYRHIQEATQPDREISPHELHDKRVPLQ